MFAPSAGVGTNTVIHNGGIQLFGMSGAASSLFITLMALLAGILMIFCLMRRHDKKAKKGVKPEKSRELLQRARDAFRQNPSDAETGAVLFEEVEVEELEAEEERDGTIELRRHPLMRRNPEADLAFWHEDETRRGYHAGRGLTSTANNLVFGMERLERAVTQNTLALERELHMMSSSTSSLQTLGGEEGQGIDKSAHSRRGLEHRGGDRKRPDAGTFLGAYAIDAGDKAVIPWTYEGDTARRGSSPGPMALPTPLWNMVRARLE